jgi:hypothetical protein
MIKDINSIKNKQNGRSRLTIHITILPFEEEFYEYIYYLGLNLSKYLLLNP